jgi:hypothetical protein
LNVLLLEFVHKVIGQHLALGTRGGVVVPRDVGVHALIAIVEAHGATEGSGATAFASRETLLMLGVESLGLLKLVHKLSFGADIILVDIEEVVNRLAIFLVKFGTKSCKN